MAQSENTVEEYTTGLEGENEAEGAEQTENAKEKGGKRKKRSVVWKHFQELPLGDDNKKRAKCIKCGVIYISESTYGTGNMLNHVRSCVKNTTKDISQLLLSQSGGGSVIMKSTKYDPDIFRELLVRAIIKHNLSFSFVEYDGIREIFKYLSDEIKLPCRNTVKACVLKLFKKERTNLQALLNSTPGKICLTSDLWTSVATDGYLTITAHFVDSDWKLNKKMLNFCLMPPPHTGVALSEKIHTLLSEWGIEKKLFSMTLDNASNNGCFVEILKSQLNLKDALVMDGDFFHVRCCTHILNLIVQDGLKEIDEAVVKVRESIKYIKGSSARKYKFYDCVQQVSLEDRRGLRQDVPTRWNSTYTMLESAIYYRRAFAHLQLSDSNYKNCLTNEEWDRVVKISKFLGLFYEITCLFSRTKYPTSNMFFPHAFVIQHSLKEAMDSRDGFLHKMGVQMNAKFEKYWSECSVILAIAVMLDPRYKIQFVEWAYSRLYGNDSYEFRRVKDSIYSLFELYVQNLCHLEASSNSRNEVRASNDQNDSIFQDFDNSYREGSSSTKKSELDKYFDDEKLGRKHDLDILSWWKVEQFRYPILSSLARDVLSIPISTVASESAFSIGGRVLDQYRSSLLPETVQALLCTRDWIFGKTVIVDDKDGSDLEALTEDVFNLRINHDSSKSGQSSNTITIGD